MIESLLVALLGAATPYPDIDNDAARIEALLSGGEGVVEARTVQRRREQSPDAPAPQLVATSTTGDEPPLTGQVGPGDLDRLQGRHVDLYADRNTHLRGMLTEVSADSVTIKVRRAGGSATLELARERIRYARVH